jgi:hypothetical protein
MVEEGKAVVRGVGAQREREKETAADELGLSGLTDLLKPGG